MTTSATVKFDDEAPVPGISSRAPLASPPAEELAEDLPARHSPVLLKALKQSLLLGLRSTRILDLTARTEWRRCRLLILAYHGVSLDDEHVWRPDLYFSTDRLRQRFEMLRRGGYAVLPFDEAFRRLQCHTLPPKAVTLTFDDGNFDFHARALPLLREFGFPATVYLTTYYTQYHAPVFPVACSYILWKGRSRSLDLSRLGVGTALVDLATPAGREEAARLFERHARTRGMTAVQKTELLQAIAEALKVDYRAMLARRVLHLMTPDELGSLSGQGVDVELHTHRHALPGDRRAFLNEIEENRRLIELYTGRRPVHFCYPNGLYDLTFLPWLQQSHVVSATTCEPSLASRDSDPLLLPRLVDSNALSAVEFEGWLSGVSHFLPQRPRGA